MTITRSPPSTREHILPKGRSDPGPITRAGVVSLRAHVRWAGTHPGRFAVNPGVPTISLAVANEPCSRTKRDDVVHGSLNSQVLRREPTPAEAGAGGLFHAQRRVDGRSGALNRGPAGVESFESAALLLLRSGSIGHNQSDREFVQARVRRISARPTPRARNVLVDVGTNGRNASEEVVLRLFNFGFDLAS